MTNYDCECLCKDIYKHFRCTLETFYENNFDCPSTLLEICISSREINTQYNISEDGVSITHIPTVPGYFIELPETGYYGTFDSEYSDALYYYKHGNSAIFLSFKYQHVNIPEVIKTLTRVFFENIIKPLSKILNQHNLDYFSCTFWRDYDEETVINKTVAEYLAYFYCIDNNFIQLLSTQKYESEMLHGLIYASQRGTERAKDDISIKLEKKVPLTENIRKTRKLMEISSSELAMIVGRDTMILGYVNLLEKKIKPYECRIEILGHLNIKYCINKTCVKYTDGIYRIADSEEYKLPSFPKTELNDSAKEAIHKINDVMRIASKQKHGTLFIIGNKKHIRKEAYRLCSLGRGTKTHPFSLLDDKENLIGSITSIDGAVFMDTNCICHGIGLILDGPAIVPGNPERGARYNSAINYVEYQIQKKRNFVAAIFSEDSSLEYYIATKD